MTSKIGSCKEIRNWLYEAREIFRDRISGINEADAAFGGSVMALIVHFECGDNPVESALTIIKGNF